VGISIYYTARRGQPLTSEELRSIERVIPAYAVEAEIERYLQTGVGDNWESFCIYDSADPTEFGIVFEGATRLPDNTPDSTWRGVQHWCKLLSEIRRIVPHADWNVHVDDHDMVWNTERHEYDPSL